MTVDSGDLPRPPEQIKASPQRMLFHVATTHEEGIDHMKRHGLLASSPTLTPRVDIGTYYNSGDFLTFWYPERGEVDRGLKETTQTPTLPVTPEKKAIMLKDLEDSNIEEWQKTSFNSVIEQAKTYLPGERLRAVAQFSSINGNPIEWIFPEDSHSFVKYYHENKDDLPSRVREALDKMKVRFLDPTLNKDVLALDIVKTYVEHNLSNLGDYHGYPVDTRADLERIIKTLQGGSFDDPVWERYRGMLISRFQKRVQSLPTVPDPGK